MKRLYRGKTKDLFLFAEDRLLLYFKDSVTGTGDCLDPGGNEVVGKVTGKGNASLRLSVFFFELLEQAGIPTHYLGPGPVENSLLVKRARSFGLEVICREKAWGSFLHRYGRYVTAGEPLPSLVEFTLKDDDRGDPPITGETLAALKIASPEAVSYTHLASRSSKVKLSIRPRLQASITWITRSGRSRSRRRRVTCSSGERALSE